MVANKKPVNYSDYLNLKTILSSQVLESEKRNMPAHDETLFIIIHQVYELWFKQILHELDDVLLMFRKNYVDEENIGIANARLDRIIEIQKILIDQIRILETMTPLDFLEFRDFLTPASGFQSFQFRLLEIKMGLKLEQRFPFNSQDYYNSFSAEEKKKLLDAEEQSSLLELVEKWLERTPFLKFENFDFAEFYRNVVQQILDNEKAEILSQTGISGQVMEARLRMVEDNKNHFNSMFDRKIHESMVAKGERVLSYKATMAALFINLYRDQPILHLPYQLLANLLDMDELFTTWRYRHSLMVLRMIGRKIGTGGSSGYEYLRSTAEKHKVFSDLFQLSTFLIPRSKLPRLPEGFLKNLGFYYSKK
jgi:tryptophan 2,3-dioxygenase